MHGKPQRCHGIKGGGLAAPFEFRVRVYQITAHKSFEHLASLVRQKPPENINSIMVLLVLIFTNNATKKNNNASRKTKYEVSLFSVQISGSTENNMNY